MAATDAVPSTNDWSAKGLPWAAAAMISVRLKLATYMGRGMTSSHQEMVPVTPLLMSRLHALVVQAGWLQGAPGRGFHALTFAHLASSWAGSGKFQTSTEPDFSPVHTAPLVCSGDEHTRTLAVINMHVDHLSVIQGVPVVPAS